jgi:hypothetical protein
MTKPIPETANPIDRLLQDRAQFVSWLTRLNSSDGVPTVPEAVRSRVRADYERRLESVLSELRTHTSALEEQVAGLSSRQGELATREAEFKEQLSEAEVRHVVGEYDDGKWEGIRAELMKVIMQVRDELAHTTAEVGRLNDVLATIRAPVLPESHPVPEPTPPPPLPSLGASAPRPALSGSGPRAAVIPEPPAPPPAPTPVHEPEPVAHPLEPARPAAAGPAAPAGGTEIPFRAITPRPAPPKAAPAPKKDDVPGRTLWFPSGKPNEQSGGKLDELAFLKSVTGGEAPAAPPPAPSPAPGPAPAPAPKSRASGGFTKPATIEAPPEPPGPRGTPAPTVDPARDRQSGQKTLKCAECGTLNRPTEWYCERCGAELAAL